MKQRSTFYCAFLMFLLSTAGLGAQEATAFTEKTDPDGRPRPNTIEFVPNEIIVKYKDGVEVAPEKLMNSSISSKKAGSPADETKIIKAEKLFPGAQMKKSLRVVKTPQGNDMVIPNLHNIYKIVLEDKKSTGYNPYDLNGIIEELKTDPNVEYAEPNYIYSIGDFTPTSPIMDMCEAQEWADLNAVEEGTGLVPNDPLYSQQWGIPACNIDDVWLTHTGDTTSVISILDTGVDWLHPDLAPNIWTNTAEIPDNGMDDDGNGYVDDVRGWDFINNDNDPKDDNSHGTHCAGIAAAVGDNSIGIAGVNWKARIMPVKVFQSSGRGDAATISQGIIYASANAADVLSMSFGGYTESITMRNALANAYATSVLVAAAGNDSRGIGPCWGCAPMYPAAFSFVLGVETQPRPPFGFTNYDQDGPVFSQYSDLLNYELIAPGLGIISCVPGGTYREYSGTSMAAPVVAGAISLYREIKSDESQELIFGNFINSLNQYIDLEATFNIIPLPKLDIVSYEITDTIDGDGDGRPDAGETIEIIVKVRNTWGQANDVKVGIEFGEFEDHSSATILNAEATVGSVSAYSLRTNIISLKIRLTNDLSNGRDVVLKLKTWYGNLLGEEFKIIQLNVENGRELSGVMDTTLILTSDRLILINSSFKIGENGHLVIEPGTKIINKKGIINLGTITGIGTADSLIIIDGPGGFYDPSAASNLIFSYTIFKNQISTSENNYPGFYFGTGSFYKCQFININYEYMMFSGSNVTLKDNIIKESNVGTLFSHPGWSVCIIEKNNFMNSKLMTGLSMQWENALNEFQSIKYNNFSNISRGVWYYGKETLLSCSADLNSSQSENNFIGFDKNNQVLHSTGINSVVKVPFQYWGTINEEKIKEMNWDFWNDPILPQLTYSPILIAPSDSAHCIVWKILVNLKDAQDEFDQLDPIGVGKQKFEVYFNRPMDTLITPLVSMGVRYPYTQTSITEDGSWSPDSTIYTVYSTIGLSTGDGINTIRVTGAKDTDQFEIPIEDRRFRVVVSAAGSLSNGFLATPGMGKVYLEWEAPDAYVGDLLGYNMYRYTFVNDSITSDTLLISESMIIDTVYTDYEVVPDTKYFYTYKTVRTNLTESSFSKIVAATPYTAAKGDANGDLAVNVSDIISTVSYILMKNPQPFILEAADYNSDGTVNILDITGIVKKILNPSKKVFSESNQLSATMFVRGDTLFVDSPVSLGGIQFTVRNTNTTSFEVLDALKSFERATISDTDSLFFLAYSMTGKTFGPGIVPLLKFNNKFVSIEDIVLSTSGGNSVIVDFKGENGTNHVNAMRDVSGIKAFPNPFSGETKISYMLPVKTKNVTFSVYNTLGKKVDEIIVKDIRIGDNSIIYHPNLNQGLYILRMTTEAQGKISIGKSLKLLIK